MKERKPEILYSDPVNEIMGNPPRRILRWGTTMMFLIFVMFILFSWLFRYPDTIPAPVEITTVNPPVTLVSKITGYIKNLYVKEGEIVKPGQLLAVMETTASVEEIKLLDKAIEGIIMPEILSSQSFPAFSELGELQGQYALFLKNLADLHSYDLNDFYGSKIKSLTVEIAGLQEYINRLLVKEKFNADNQKLESKKFKRDSSLNSQGLMPQSELEKSHQSLIRMNIELEQARLDYSAKTVEMAGQRQLLAESRIRKVEEREKLISILRESFLNLKAQLNIWESNYLLVSPTEGIVSFTRFWSANQSVVKDDPVMYVVPLETGNFFGRITLKMQRSGKVKPGQMVNIKFSGYPYLEYGMVRGIVESKSRVPSGDAYIIGITLPDGLKTLYGKKLDFQQNMQGTAEIITEDNRLLQRIVNPFRYLFSKNKR
jgi:HlyD family secretion protein